MKPEEMIRETMKLYEECTQLMSRKNHDYSEETDAFSNFKKIEALGIASVETVIMTRIADKLTRMTNLLTVEAAVKDETMTDSIMDCINYLALLKIYKGEK